MKIFLSKILSASRLRLWYILIVTLLIARSSFADTFGLVHCESAFRHLEGYQYLAGIPESGHTGYVDYAGSWGDYPGDLEFFQSNGGKVIPLSLYPARLNDLLPFPEEIPEFNFTSSYVAAFTQLWNFEGNPTYYYLDITQARVWVKVDSPAIESIRIPCIQVDTLNSPTESGSPEVRCSSTTEMVIPQGHTVSKPCDIVDRSEFEFDQIGDDLGQWESTLVPLTIDGTRNGGDGRDPLSNDYFNPRIYHQTLYVGDLVSWNLDLDIYTRFMPCLTNPIYFIDEIAPMLMCTWKAIGPDGVVIKGPSGVGANVWPEATASGITAKPGKYTITCTVQLENGQKVDVTSVKNVVWALIAADADRNGDIDFDKDNTTVSRPFRFWLNNDHDNYSNDTYNAENDHPWTSESLDNANSVIESQRDLDDLARLHLKIADIQSELESGVMTLGLKWKNAISGAPKIRIFKAIESDGGTKYLSVESQAAAQMTYARNELGVIQGSSVLDLPKSFWTPTSGNAKKYLLFEALDEGKGELILIIKKNGIIVGESGSVFLDLLDIRKMYERWKIADTASFPDPDVVTASSVSGITSIADPNSHAFQVAWDEDPNDRSYVICVHGWRKSYFGARSDEITIFKRLWHRGFKGRYAGFYWPTLTGGEITAKFNHSEYRAWKCGDAFKTFIDSQLPTNYRKNVIAHSMGNIVVSSALNKGLRFDRFALLNGAIPAQCFDTDPALRQIAATQSLATGVWGVGAITYDAWAGGDLGDDTLASLRLLAYRNRISSVGNTKLINFFLEADSATKDGWEANQWGAGDGYPGIDSKPIDGYAYDVGSRLNYDPVGIGDRALADPHEAMSMANQSMTKAVGADGRTRGTVAEAEDLNVLIPGIFDEHEAEFKFRSSRTWEFYKVLLEKLGYSPNP